MSTPLTVSLKVLGATAGLGALATFVGGATLWLRFEALDLPADRAVAVLPTELLVVVGAHALIVPVAIGLGALAVLALIDPFEDDGGVRKGFRVWLMAFTVLAVFVGVILTAFDKDVPLILLALAGAAATVFVVGKASADGRLVRHIGWIVFAAFALYGALLAILETAAEPKMEPVAALLKTNDRGLAGFFVGESSDRFWFVSLPGNADPGDPFADAPVDRVVAIPRSEVKAVATREPTGVGDDDRGRQQAHTLLADLRFTVQETQLDTTVEPVVTNSPEVAFAPLVHLHSDEDLLPMSARGFLDGSVLRWSNRGGPCDDVTVAVGRSLAEDRPGAPTLADASLGATDPYVHRLTERCGGRPQPVAAIERTRPYDPDRPAGVPLRQGFYLDLDDDRYGGHDELDDEGPQTLLRDVPVYADTQEGAELTPRERDLLPAGRDGGDAIRITYWMLYALSEPPGAAGNVRALGHEGDWERISVLALPPDPEASQPPQQTGYLPVAARYHYHNDARTIPWYAVKRTIGGTDTGESPTHPVVYSAEGSHASYWQAGRFESVFKPKGRRLLAVDDDAIACPRCPRWETWRLVLPARDQLWYGFGGAWGRVGLNRDTTGPVGPSNFKLGIDEPVEPPRPQEATPLPTAPTEVDEAIQER